MQNKNSSIKIIARQCATTTDRRTSCWIERTAAPRPLTPPPRGARGAPALACRQSSPLRKRPAGHQPAALGAGHARWDLAERPGGATTTPATMAAVGQAEEEVSAGEAMEALEAGTAGDEAAAGALAVAAWVMAAAGALAAAGAGP